MKHRHNAPAETPEEYRRDMFLPFLDRVTANLEDTFKYHESRIVSLQRNNAGKMYKFKYERYNTCSGILS